MTNPVIITFEYKFRTGILWENIYVMRWVSFIKIIYSSSDQMKIGFGKVFVKRLDE